MLSEVTVVEIGDGPVPEDERDADLAADWMHRDEPARSVVKQHVLRLAGIEIRWLSRPAESTNRMPVAWVAAARRASTTPICSTTGRAGPRTSTGLPLDRWPSARSTTVGQNPTRANQ